MFLPILIGFTLEQAPQPHLPDGSAVIGEKEKSFASTFVTYLNSKDVASISKLLGGNFIWGGGDRIGQTDSFIAWVKKNGADDRTWKIEITKVSRAYLVDGLLCQFIPKKNSGSIVPIIKIHVNEFWFNPNNPPLGTREKVEYSIYLQVHNDKIKRIILGSPNDVA